MTRAIVLLSVLVACGGGGGGSGDDDDDGVAIDAAASDVDAPGSDGAPAIDAPPTSSADPGAPGAWMVHTQATVTIALGQAGNVAGTVYSPSTDGATPAAGPFPLVIVSSGYQLARTQYRIFCE